MAKYSRVSKYEDLRNRLQNDTDTSIESKDLSKFEQKLNDISSTHFEAPKEQTYDSENYDPIHARRRQYLDNTTTSVNTATNTNTQVETKPTFTRETDNVNYTPFNNDYINDYIREVKQYNLEQGNAYSTNTDLNVLHSINKDKTPPVPSKPYTEETKSYDLNPFYAARKEPVEKNDSPTISLKKTLNDSYNTRDSYTSEIPTFKSNKRTFDEFMDDDNDDLDTGTMTKEDIATEVQNLIRGQNFDSTSSSNKKSSKKDHSDTLDYHFEAERNARQQLLNETTQMRAQLDNYEDNLSEVSNRMVHQDKMISNVLIVLIIVLIVVLLVVVYWILNANGIL